MRQADLEALPSEARGLWGTITSAETLGASRQLLLLSRLLSTLSTSFEGDDTRMRALLEAMSQELLTARGESSQAFPNGLRLMLAGLEEESAADGQGLRARLRNSVDEFVQQQQVAAERMTDAGLELLNGVRCLIAYDYSGSVADILTGLASSTSPPEVVVLESRALDGGRKFVRDLASRRVRMRFWPDAAMGAALRGADAVLVGAETLTLEGGCYNTVGTALLALAARHEGVPLYVVSTSLKIDLGTDGGPERLIPSRDLQPILDATAEFHTMAAVSMVCPDLDYTPPSLVSGLITEAGCVSPPEIEGLAATLAEKLDGRA